MPWFVLKMLQVYLKHCSTDHGTEMDSKTGAAKETGQLESLTHSVEASESERKLYFALKVLDNVGNASNRGSIEVNVPAQPPAEG